MRVEIKRFDERGMGVGGDLHIPFAYPGDFVEVETVNKRKKLGRLKKLIEASKDRIQAPCKYFGECGGCRWQGLNYTAQLKAKEDLVKSFFGDCHPILPSTETFYYRNRMDFAFGPGFSIGLKTSEDKILNLDKCLLMSENSNKILDHLRYYVSLKKLLHYREGILRHVIIREGKFIKNTLINILTSKGEFDLEDLWMHICNHTQGLVWSINRSPADRSTGDIQKVIGKDHLEEQLGHLKFKIPAQSFFQTNPVQSLRLLETIERFAGLTGSEKVLELYSGVGTIGLYLAHKAEEVIGVEENTDAVRDAEVNAILNNIQNYTALVGRAEDVIKEFEYSFDVAILDPPRPGVHKKVLQMLGEARPDRIVYVSCNPASQKHDIVMLKTLGYEIQEVQPLDMFPHTPHIENVILLTF